MKKFLALIMFLLLIAPLAHASLVLTFDDGAPIDGANITTGYGGFLWENMMYNDKTDGPPGFEIGTVSGIYAAFNNPWYPGAGRVTRAISGDVFTFEGAYFTAGWQENIKLEIKGLVGGVQSYISTLTLSTDAATLLTCNFENIDELILTATGGDGDVSNFDRTHFIMDDFKFDTEAASSVPIPSTIGLLGLGLLGLSGVSRKKQA